MSIHKTSLILRNFTNEKLKSFRLFLDSSYFNNRKSLLELYDCILLYKPQFEFKSIELYISNKNILSDKFTDDKYTIKMLSFLFKELERFIIIEEITNNQKKSKISLLEYYNNMEIVDLYSDTLRDIKMQIDISCDTSIYNYIMNDIDTTFQSKYDNRKGDINYTNTYNSIELFYYYNKYKLRCLMLNRNQIIPNNYELAELEADILTKDILIKNINIQLFYKLYQLIKNPIDSNITYIEYKKFLEDIISDINQEDLSIAYVILSNYCKHFFKNKTEYLEELLYIYKKQIEIGSFYINNKIHISYLNNIIKVFILNKEYKNALSFLEANKDCIIPEEESDTTYNFLISQIYFAQKDYDKSLSYLSKTKTNDNFIKLAIKRQYLKIFFEKEELNTFDSFTNSYKVFLSRDETLTKEKKEIEKNFVNSMILINRYRLEKNKSKLTTLGKKIEQEHISEKSFLLEKINEYLK